MRQLRYVDFDCQSCGDSCTRFVYFNTDANIVDDEEQFCDVQTIDISSPREELINCGGVLVPREMSGVGYMKTITRGNADFSERERARLEKRADDHWRRQGRDEAVDRERAFLKKHGASGGVF